MNKHLWMCVALVSLLFVGMLPVVEAPHNRTWDIRYQANNVLPENDGWTRDTLGNVYREFVFNDQILRVNFTSGALGTEQYIRSDLEDSTMYLIEARIRVNNTMMSGWITFRLESSTGGETLGIQIFDPFTKICRDVTCFTYHTQNITNANHTWRFIVWRDTSAGKMAISAYLDEYYLGFRHSSISGYYYYDTIRWRMDYENNVPDLKIDTDYILIRTNNTEDYLLDELAERDAKINDLEDEIDDLKRELERLKKQTNPDVVTNQSTLPTIPYGNRGIEDNTLFVDPYRTIVYSVKVSDSGSDLAFSKPYPTTSDEITVISDEIYIAPISYTRLWINDTAGAGTELLNVSTDVTYYNIQWGYAITVQTSGASSSVRADRVTTVRLIDSFNWGWNRDAGLFGHTSTISNSISYNMENVRAYWAFPQSDADGRDIQIDVASIEVWDDDNNVQLDKGRHYEATEAGGVSLEYRWVNTTGTSASRTIRIQFTRASLSQSESYHTIYDNDISIADTYGNAPFTTNVHHTQHGAANFEGKIIIRFDLTGRYAGEHIDTRTLIIKRSDQSGSSQFTYDSISNELRITDVTVDAGDSITFSLYWDWYDEKSAVYELILGDPLILYSLLLLAGFSGLFIFLDAKSEEKRRKYAGIIIIVVDVAILIIILLAPRAG